MKSRSPFLSSIVLFFSVIIYTFSISALASDATGVSTLTQRRSQHTATLLPNGNVLVVGGTSSGNTTEFYNPVTGIWTAGATLPLSYSGHTATLLPNGKVLIVGGYALQLYDPQQNSWSAAGIFSVYHVGHTATLLANGKVLIVGGIGSTVSANTIIYDPISNSSTRVANSLSPHTYHTATRMLNGKVLIVGNSTNTGDLYSAEVYDPNANTWTAVGAANVSRYRHTATLLNTGDVLIANGYSFSVNRNTNSTMLFKTTYNWVNVTLDSQAMTSNYCYPKQAATATLIGDKVLVAGGLPSTEIDFYNIGENIWNDYSLNYTLYPRIIGQRIYHTSTLLQDGNVLLTGGGYMPTNAEVYVSSAPAMQITCPPNQIVQATSPAGATVTFPSASAVDNIPLAPFISYSQNSGTVFPVGVTTVKVTAVGATGNVMTSIFTVTVRNTTTLTVVPPPNIVIDSVYSTGGLVTDFGHVSLPDAVTTGAPPTISFNHPSPLFPIGVTTVTVTVKDSANNTGSAIFTIKVRQISLAFTSQPADTVANTQFSPAVSVSYIDSDGNIRADYLKPIALSLSNNFAILGGNTTVTPVNGTATFSNLSINSGGYYNELYAQADGFYGVYSNQFNTLNPAPTVTSINPPSCLANATGDYITITGSNFLPGVKAQINGMNVDTEYLNSTTLRFRNLYFTVVGVQQIYVVNPPPTAIGTHNSISILVHSAPALHLSNTQNYFNNSEITGNYSTDGSSWLTGIEIFDGNTSIAQLAVVNVTSDNFNYSFMATANPPIPDGNYTMHFTFFDSDGSSEMQNQQVVFDNTPPQFSYNIPMDARTPLLFGINASLYIQDPPFANGQPSWGVNPSSITVIDSTTLTNVPYHINDSGIELQNVSGGFNSYIVTAADYAGNTASFDWTFSVPTETITFTSPTAGYLNNLDPKITCNLNWFNGVISTNVLTAYVTGSDNVNHTLIVTYTDASHCELTPNTSLPDDNYWVTATITDVSGFVIFTAPWHFAVDLMPPDIRFVTPFAESTINIPDPIINGTFIDLGAGLDLTSCKIYLDDNPMPIPLSFHTSIIQSFYAAYGYTALNVTDFTALPPGSLDEGVHLMTIIAADNAGNSSKTKQYFIVDFTYPSYEYRYNDTQVFSIETPAGWAVVVKATEDGVDVSQIGTPSIQLELFGTTYTGSVNLVSFPVNPPALSYANIYVYCPWQSIPFGAEQTIQVGGVPWFNTGSSEAATVPIPNNGLLTESINDQHENAP